MININDQETLFNNIGRNLPDKLSSYAIGGTAMMLLGLKAETKDIDLVFDKESDRKLFIKTLEGMKFRKDEKRIIETYGLKRNTPMMLRLESDKFIFDLFLNKVITSTFSERMKERAKQTHEFGRNLIIKVAEPCDIVIMKSATSRAKDMEDIISIITNTKMNWEILVKESEEQVKLGNETAINSLGEKLEKLDNQGAITLPKDVLDSLWKMLKKQVKNKSSARK